MTRNAKEPSWEYEDSDYWDRTYNLEESHVSEKATTEGNDGEQEFDNKMLHAAVGKEVLDVGCGDGLFTIQLSQKAKSVIGVDFSKTAISEAIMNLTRSAIKNVRFQLGEADSLPFPDESFDIVTCRRGPITDKMKSLLEARRVLRKGGSLMEITIGEHDKENIAQTFGRGQMLGFEKVSTLKDRMVREAGLEPLEIQDYTAMEIFQTIDDLIIRLKNSPIIPEFDVAKDRACLDKVEKTCKTKRGIETQTHRVTIIARK